MVTAAPEVQKVGPDPTVESGLPRMNDVCAPGCRVNVLVWKVRGALAEREPDGPPTDQVAGPPETMPQGAEHAGRVVEPVFVPANTTWQVDAAQEIGLPPLFLIEIETARGEESVDAPALREAPTTATLVFVVALFTKL